MTATLVRSTAHLACAVVALLTINSPVHAQQNDWTTAEILDGLSDQNPKRRATAAWHAKRNDEQLVDTLVGALSDSDTNVRNRAAAALASMKNEKAAEATYANLANGHFGVRQNLYYRFSSQRSVPADLLPPLQAGLADLSVLVRQRAASGIGKISSDAANAAKAKLVDNPDPSVRRNIFYFLASKPTPDSLRLFAKGLQDTDNGVRLRAASGLRSLRADGVAAVMLKCFAHHDPAIRQQAAAYFSGSSEANAIDHLIAALEDIDDDVRKRAAASLAKVDQPRARAALQEFKRLEQQKPDAQKLLDNAPSLAKLQELLDHRNAAVRHGTAKRIGQQSNEARTKAALAAFDHPDPTVRALLINHFTTFPDASAVPSLDAALKDMDATVRLHAARALRSTPGQAARTACLAALNHADPVVRAQVVYRFYELPEPAVVPKLVNALNDMDDTVRLHAAQGLQNTPGEATVKAVVAHLNHPDPAVRLQLVYRFGVKSDANELAEVVLPVAAALHDPDTEVRKYASLALAKAPGDSATQKALAAMNHTDPEVRRHLAYRFQLTPDERAGGRLIALLEDWSSDVRLQAMRSLGYSGNDQAFTSLRLFLDDERKEVRQHAGGALKTLAGRITADSTVRGHSFLVQERVADSLRPLPRTRIPVPESYVEFLGGDRIAGEVLGFVGSDEAKPAGLPPHLLIDPQQMFVAPVASSASSSRSVRVVTRWIRRIVWERRSGGTGRYQPRTAFLRGGREIEFRTLRWRDDGVVLLTVHGTENVEFRNLNELHLPQADPWTAYYQQLATCGVGPAEPLLRLVHFDGSRTTVAASRFGAFADLAQADPRDWRHFFQPAWSLDVLAVPHSRVWLRSSGPAADVPLFSPVDYEPKSNFYFAWQVDHNVHGDSAVTEYRHSRWGFGVHADNVLQFAVPDVKARFETGVGLDHSVGHGGCARAIVRLRDEGRMADLYKSPLLIGSNKLHATGSLNLPGGGIDRRLELVADSAHDGRPQGAAPLNFRDMVNWFEPRFQLDVEDMQSRVAGHATELIAEQTGWQLQEGDDRAIALTSLWWDGRGAPRSVLVVRRAPVKLTRRIPGGHNAKQLLLKVWQTDESVQPARIEVHINDKPAGVFTIPKYKLHHVAAPIVVPVNVPGDRDLTVTIHHLDAVAGGIFYEDSSYDSRLPSPLALFEDDATLARADDNRTGEAALTKDDAFSGSRAVKLTSGGRFQLALPEPIKISEQPGDDSIQFLRFAFRKRGRGQVSLELRSSAPRATPIRYQAGAGEPAYGPAKKTWPAGIPDEWVVAEFDLFADWGEAEIDALVLGAPDGDHALFDHVYLARKRNDFGRLTGVASIAETNFRARRALSQPVLDKARPAIVSIEVEGRRGTGVLIGDAGRVLTSADVLGEVGREAVVRLSDGSKAMGKVSKIDQDSGCGIIELAQRSNLTGLMLSDRKELPHIGLYVGFSFSPRFYEARQAQSYLTMIVAATEKTFQTNYQVSGAWPGGPLLDDRGEIVGIHTDKTSFLRVSPLIQVANEK